MTETDFEKVLFQALKENATENYEKLLEGFNPDYAHVFSQKFHKAMYRDLKSLGINPRGIVKISNKIKYKKYLSAVASVIVIFTGISFAVPEVRATIWGTVIEWFENHIIIYFSDTGKIKIDRDNIIYPEYIPSGYEKISEIIGENNADVFYSNGEDYINFSFYVSSLSVGTDNRISEYKEIKIKDYDGFIFSYDGLNILLWQDENYTYELNAQNNDVDLVQIAESIYNKK